jgi:hypothetical protein
MGAPIGLEIWLTGAPHELDAAARVLARLGRITWRSQRHRLTGADAGRYRVYVHIHVAAAWIPYPATAVPTKPDTATLPGLAA